MQQYKVQVMTTLGNVGGHKYLRNNIGLQTWLGTQLENVSGETGIKQKGY